jgi:hypothetical protein
LVEVESRANREKEEVVYYYREDNRGEERGETGGETP